MRSTHDQLVELLVYGMHPRVLWPHCSHFLFNSHRYQGFAVLFIAHSKVFLLSREGVTQGDPLAMLFYGIGVLPLTRMLKKADLWKQNWCADDSGCFGLL